MSSPNENIGGTLQVWERPAVLNRFLFWSDRFNGVAQVSTHFDKWFGGSKLVDISHAFLIGREPVPEKWASCTGFIFTLQNGAVHPLAAWLSQHFFKRDGKEALVYYFDKFDRQFRMVELDWIKRRI